MLTQLLLAKNKKILISLHTFIFEHYIERYTVMNNLILVIHCNSTIIFFTIVTNNNKLLNKNSLLICDIKQKKYFFYILLSVLKFYHLYNLFLSFLFLL